MNKKDCPRCGGNGEVPVPGTYGPTISPEAGETRTCGTCDGYGEVADSPHPTPPGPPGAPTHTHDDGTRCMWVRVNHIDRWRQVGHLGRDLGPCPGLKA